MKQSSIEVDLLVVGAGMAGVLAALAASAEGLDVMLLERTYTPGGQATSLLISEMSGYTYRGEPLYGGFEAEIVEQLEAVGSGKHYMNDRLVPHPTMRGDNFRYNPEILKIQLDWFIERSNIQALGGCQIESARETETGVAVTASGGEELFAIDAAVAIDATGSAALTTMAGFGTYRSSLVQQELATLMFRLSGADVEALERFAASRDLAELVKAGFDEGVLPGRYISLAPIPGTSDVSVNATRTFVDSDVPREMTRGMIALRTQILRMIPFLKQNVPGLASASLASMGQYLGIRDGRRIRAQTELTGADIESGRRFPDAVAFGCFPMGLHNPVTDEIEWTDTGGVYGIPYGALLPQGSQRIIAAGKCIGVDALAATTARNIPVVMNTGEAAGLAAAMAVRKKTPLPSLDVAFLRKKLDEKGLKIHSHA